MVIEPISCLKDNYAYLLFVPGAGDAYVVDPSEPAPIEAALRRHGLVLRGILHAPSRRSCRGHRGVAGVGARA